MKRIAYGVLLLLVVAGSFLGGSWYTGRTTPNDRASGARKVLYYVDPMHPAYKSDKPGIAPDCGMELVPVYEDGTTGGAGTGGTAPAGTVTVKADKQQLIGVQVGRVEKVPQARTLRTLGRVAVDENRTYRLIAATEGWIRELRGGTTGSLVKKDDVLATFYSRDLAGAQQALFFGFNTLERYQAAKAPEDQLMAAHNQIRAAEITLTTLGMSETQIQELTRTRKATREIEIRAPVTGFVQARNVFPSLRVDRSTEFYRIVDISQVWIVADLFEDEGRYFRPGVTARLILPMFPGTVFQARVTDIFPQTDPTTRTLKVRLEADNPGLVLRPDMFVDVELPITLAPAIAVPVDAVVDSGVKKTVYVAKGDGVFEPRKVETGWRHGDRVEIVKGLMPGEQIVVSGTFLLDSDSRMKAAAAGIYGESSEDPVCGMEVDMAKAKAVGQTSQIQGQTYYFCSDDCKTTFDKVPTRYTGKAGKGATTDAGKRLEGVQWDSDKTKAPAPAHTGHAHPPDPPAHPANHR